MMEYDNSPPCSSRFFKNGVDATTTAAVGSANSSSSALSREKEAAAGVANWATIVARRMNRLMVVFFVSCLLDNDVNNVRLFLIFEFLFLHQADCVQ